MTMAHWEQPAPRLSNASLDFSERLRGVSDLDECWSELHNEIEKYGFVSALYGFLPFCYPNATANDIFIQLCSHPDPFMECYEQKGHVNHDYGVTHCRISETTFRWFDPSYLRHLPKRAREVETDANDFGIKSGLSIPLRGGNIMDWGGIGLNAGDMNTKTFDDLLTGHLDELINVASTFHATILERRISLERPHLSARQKESLLWAASGLSVVDTAGRMGLRPETVSLHLTKARKKLDAHNTTQAVARALALNLIHL